MFNEHVQKRFVRDFALLFIDKGIIYGHFTKIKLER